MPRLCITMPSLVERLKGAYPLFTNGKFPEALEAFQGIVCAATLIVVETRQQVGELKELLTICSEYMTAIRLELARRTTQTSDPKRSIELAAYFTHQNLQPTHKMLALKSAMGVAFKLKLLTAAGGFARRLLEENPRPEIATQARKVVQLSEQTPGNAFEFDYNEKNPFLVCNADLTPIYRGSVKIVRCKLCRAAYLPSYKGKKCDNCGLGEIVEGDLAGLNEQAVLARGALD